MPKTLKPSVCIDAVFENVPVDDALSIVKQAGIEMRHRRAVFTSQ